MNPPEQPVPPEPDASRRAERNRRMVEDWEGGATITQIAHRYGLSLSWTGMLLRLNGAALPKTGRGIKRDLDTEQVSAEYLDGATIRTIADDHGVSYGKIYRLLQQHHVPMRPRGGGQRAASTKTPPGIDTQ
ncbi:helix-turn-helix domain-containing protein [Amycolatopsis sp. NBC_00355]|uniref:helix-turn-helix domain-containing protein n=1 Tax=Amycolatopsis sp. NBC_00355 TaxID=2975957 RepID=UPI002E275AF3